MVKNLDHIGPHTQVSFLRMLYVLKTDKVLNLHNKQEAKWFEEFLEFIEFPYEVEIQDKTEDNGGYPKFRFEKKGDLKISHSKFNTLK